MIILDPQQAVFVGIPRAGSKAVSLWLEKALRSPSYALQPAESLHSYHASIPEAMEVTSSPLWAYWSFAFVRNPFDRLVSYCAMFDDDFLLHPRLALHRALEQPVNRWTMPQHDLLEGVKTVYRFEDLSAGIQDIATRLGIAQEFRQENESSHDPYRGYFTPELRELVEVRYGPDLQVYNYGF